MYRDQPAENVLKPLVHQLKINLSNASMTVSNYLGFHLSSCKVLCLFLSPDGTSAHGGQKYPILLSLEYLFAITYGPSCWFLVWLGCLTIILSLIVWLLRSCIFTGYTGVRTHWAPWWGRPYVSRITIDTHWKRFELTNTVTQMDLFYFGFLCLFSLLILASGSSLTPTMFWSGNTADLEFTCSSEGWKRNTLNYWCQRDSIHVNFESHTASGDGRGRYGG